MKYNWQYFNLYLLNMYRLYNANATSKNLAITIFQSRNKTLQ
jgi:hypothetical protein